MKTIGNILIILFVLVTVYALRNDVLPVAYRTLDYIGTALGYPNITGNESEVLPEIVVTDKEAEETGQVNSPGPLKVTVTNNTAAKLSITAESIIIATNNERAKNGSLPALQENNLLDRTASSKAYDMLAKQYFEHTSPSGVTVGNQADDTGYEYIILGENLALGNFNDADSILDAWMNSPGHRANILNPQYTEMGAGLVKGTYKGQIVWFAVQHFGTPRSICPNVDIKLKADIDIWQASITTLKSQIDAKEKEINESSQTSYEYAGLVVDYNLMVKSYNNQIIALKGKISVYNDQVKTFNTCAASRRG